MSRETEFDEVIVDPPRERDSTKFMWIVLGAIVVGGISVAGWFGSAVITLQQQVARLEAKVDFLVADRKPLFRGGVEERHE